MQSQSVHEMDRTPKEERPPQHAEIFSLLGKTVNAITQAMDKVHPFEPTVDELNLGLIQLDRAFEMLHSARFKLYADIYGEDAERGEVTYTERRLCVEVASNGDIHVSVEKE